MLGVRWMVWVFAGWCGCWLVLTVDARIVSRCFSYLIVVASEGFCVSFCGCVGSFGGFVGVVVGGVGGGWAIS